MPVVTLFIVEELNDSAANARTHFLSHKNYSAVVNLGVLVVGQKAFSSSKMMFALPLGHTEGVFFIHRKRRILHFAATLCVSQMQSNAEYETQKRKRTAFGCKRRRNGTQSEKRIAPECVSAHARQGHSAPKWVSHLSMVVFPLKWWVQTPNMCWCMVWSVIKSCA